MRIAGMSGLSLRAIGDPVSMEADSA